MQNEKLFTLIKKGIDYIITKNGSIKSSIDELELLFKNNEGSLPIEIVNYLKSLVQKEALNAWKANNCRGIIAMATGTGKSRIPINYLEEGMKSTILIVPTEKLRDENWATEFRKLDRLYFYNNIHRECYASIKNIKDRHWRLAILDEGHNISQLNSTFFGNNEIHQVMLLTATVPTDPIKLQIFEDLNLPIVYQLTLDEAVKLRLVSPYEITIIETELDNNYKYVKSGNFKITEKQSYDRINKVIDKLEPRINNTTDLTGGFVEGGYGFSDDTCNKSLTPKEKKLLDTMIMKRMKQIYGSYAKEEVGKWIINTIGYEHNRLIIFCGNIKQAERLTVSNYHSKSKDHCYLQAFVQEKTHILACVNSLNEGMNIPNVDCGVVLQCNSKEKDLIQRLGRILRYRENHIGKLIIVVCKDTVDEKWVNKAIENLDNTKIRRINFANLKVGNELL